MLGLEKTLAAYKRLYQCMPEDPGDRGQPDNSREITQEESTLEGERSERWFLLMEEDIKDNRRRSVQNQQFLEVLDFRTVWIMRLLTAVLATLIAGGIVQLYAL